MGKIIGWIILIVVVAYLLDINLAALLHSIGGAAQDVHRSNGG